MSFDTLAPQEPSNNPDAFMSELNRQRSTSAEASDANWQLAKMNTLGANLERLANVSAINSDIESSPSQQRKLSPDELNKKYPGLREPFTEPMYERAADVIGRYRQNKQTLEDTVASGPQGMTDKAGRFIGGLFAHITDPAELGAMIVTGGAYEATAVPGLIAQAAGRAAPFVGSVARGAVEMAGVEGVNALNAKKAQESYGATDYLENTLGGALAFEGARFGLGRVMRGASGFVRGFRSGIEGHGPIQAEMERAAVGQLAQGRKVDVSSLMEDLRSETSGDGGGKYEYKPVTKANDRSWYAASETATSDYHKAATVQLGDDLGEGHYLVDNPFAANGAAARKLSLQDGTVFETKLDDSVRLLNLNESPTEEVRGALAEAFGNKEVDRILERDGTTKNVLDYIQGSNPELYARGIEDFNQRMRAADYDGYVHDGTSYLGEQHPAQNHVMLFEKDPANANHTHPTGNYAPDRSQVPDTLTPRAESLAEREQSPERQAFHDPEALKQWEELSSREQPDNKLTTLKKVESELLKQVNDLAEQGHLPEDLKNDIQEQLKEIDQNSSLMQKALKAATVCVGRPG